MATRPRIPSPRTVILGGLVSLWAAFAFGCGDGVEFDPLALLPGAPAPAAEEQSPRPQAVEEVAEAPEVEESVTVSPGGQVDEETLMMERM